MVHIVITMLWRIIGLFSGVHVTFRLMLVLHVVCRNFPAIWLRTDGGGAQTTVWCVITSCAKIRLFTRFGGRCCFHLEDYVIWFRPMLKHSLTLNIEAAFSTFRTNLLTYALSGSRRPNLNKNLRGFHKCSLCATVSRAGRQKRC